MSKKSNVTLAAISPETASKVAKGLERAAAKAEKATVTLLSEVTTLARMLPPLTAAQWDKQISPLLRDAFKRSKAGLADTTVASYRSRFKTAGLAIASKADALQPLAGETLLAYVARVAEPLGSAKLPDGSPIYAPDQVRPGRAAGSKPSKPSKGGSLDASKGGVDRGEGGENRRPKLAAALILADQNESLAAKLEIAVTSYRDELAKWLEHILSEADKAELKATLQPKAQAQPKTSAQPKAKAPAKAA